MPLRTVGLIGAVCLTVGWLLASVLTPPVARLQTLPERPARPLAAAEPQSAFTEHLQFRLQQAPQPPVTRRNPFVFAPRAQRSVAASSSLPAAAPLVAPAEVPSMPVAVGPVFSLAGIGITGDTRTAILSDGQDVHVLKIGDRVGGYEIVEITDSSAILADAAGLRFTLRLR